MFPLKQKLNKSINLGCSVCLGEDCMTVHEFPILHVKVNTLRVEEMLNL